MATSTTYRCYGLVVTSELALPDLGPAVAEAGEPDVVVRLGALEPPRVEPGPYGLWRDGDRCGVLVPEVARYEARRGREIVVDLADGADPAAVRLFVLGSMMGAVMMQRDHLVLHGTAVRVDEACAVVVGSSGAGKSTLAAELDRRGLDVLSDDVVPIDAGGRALPGYPRIKLWGDALERLGVDSAGLERVRDRHEKFQLPLRRGELGPLPVRWVYALERHPGEGVRLTPVHGAETFALLHEHTYRNELLRGAAPVARHLQQCAALVRVARLTRVERPAESMTAAATADAILADIRSDQPQERA